MRKQESKLLSVIYIVLFNLFIHLLLTFFREYLTGFSKRKAERRKKFNEKLKKEIKSERKRLQSELRENIKKSASNRAIPGLENLVENAAHVFELPEHTVTIEPIMDTSLNSEMIFLGKNEVRHGLLFFFSVITVLIVSYFICI